MPLYRVYGIVIRSDVPLPELAFVGLSPSRCQPDLSVSLKPLRRSRLGRLPWSILYEDDAGAVWTLWARTDRDYYLRFPQVADFRISAAGDRIECIGRGSETSPATLRHLLLDLILPATLSIRGDEALHATAVITEHGLCAFTGPSGSGKSTLAASFLLAGCPSFGDDCLALKADGSRIVGAPAYPGVRLWRDSIDSIAGPRNPGGMRALTRVAHYTSKHRAFERESAVHFASEPQPLAAIYRIAREPAGRNGHPAPPPKIEPLGGREAMLELINASYRLDLANRELLAREFRFLERVARLVPVRRLRVPDDFDALPAVRAAVLSDLAAL